MRDLLKTGQEGCIQMRLGTTVIKRIFQNELSILSKYMILRQLRGFKGEGFLRD